MSLEFRELLKKIGSGTHTGESLTRDESAIATRMMLLGEATPAQIGAFLISHRIKRPTGEELAGMLDIYDQLGPKLTPPNTPFTGNINEELPPPNTPLVRGENEELTPSKRPFSGRTIVLGIPYDGRSRTAPISPLTALLLTTVGVPVIMHGGGRMPTKEGLPLIEVWQGLGVDWTKLSLSQVQTVFNTTYLGFVNLASHFPLAEHFVTYRHEIGKRVPFATMELIWAPYTGDAHIISGYVHPPTEIMFREALAIREFKAFTSIKGLEGSCDIPRDRTAIIGYNHPDDEYPDNFERLLLHPRDYGFAGKEVPLESTSQLIEEMTGVLQGKKSELMLSAIWNGGFYLWHCGICSDLNQGLNKAETLLTNGEVYQKLEQIRQAV
ncbi:MAG: anthranilate phosphoribosyltransferase family protein [Microcoleaceae cyanobacterium]